MLSLSTTQKCQRLLYGLSMGLFCLMFIASAIWSLGDLSGTIKETGQLGYPAFTVIPLAVAKLLGIAAILTRRSQTLRDFAFAGFLFDLILATLGHYYHPGIGTGIGLALFGIIVWICAFLADRFYRDAGKAA